jgi:hypothetical protein
MVLTCDATRTLTASTGLSLFHPQRIHSHNEIAEAVRLQCASEFKLSPFVFYGSRWKIFGRHVLSFSEMLPFSLNEFPVGHFPYILESKRV